MSFRFADWWLLGLLLLPVFIFLLKPRRGGAEYGPYRLLRQTLNTSSGPAYYRFLIASALGFLAVAAARPQYGQKITEREQSGRDLVLVIDLSGSMQVDDIEDGAGHRSDRLAAVIAAAKDFVAERVNDRIGLVFFASTALTSCPLTYDHETVVQFLERTDKQQRNLWQQNGSGLLKDGTNLGLGLGAALKGLSTLGAKGRSIILITDGKDSLELPNWVDPLVAARHATSKGVTVHAIGVGNANGTMTAQDPFGRVFKQRVSANYLPDIGRLKQITSLANGEASIASDREGLAKIFKRIDELEPSPRTVRERDDYSDRYFWPLAIGAALLALALALEPRLRGVA